MPELNICTKNTLCADCKDTNCTHAGKLMADCPKYKCDNDVLLDCDNCKFIRQFVKNARTITKYEDALSRHIETALDRYSCDDIDMVRNEITNKLELMYHSDNNSFVVVENICDADDVNVHLIQDVCNKYHIGYCL